MLNFFKIFSFLITTQMRQINVVSLFFLIAVPKVSGWYFNYKRSYVGEKKLIIWLRESSKIWPYIYILFFAAAEVNEAIQHALKVSREGSCQWPRARVVPVRDVYPSSSTTYVPHCAILHRCSDDTGCCRSEALTCVPKHTHRVELYFYVSRIFYSLRIAIIHLFRKEHHR